MNLFDKCRFRPLLDLDNRPRPNRKPHLRETKSAVKAKMVKASRFKLIAALI